jgi:hypothetical protein
MKRKVKGNGKTVAREMSLVAPESSTCWLKFQGLQDVNNLVPYTQVVYSLNSPYDPFVSTGGGNCTGFAEWMGLYDFCFVDRVQIEVSYYNTSTTVPAIMYVVPYPSYQTAGAPTRDLLLESQRAKSHTVFFGNTLHNPHTLTVEYDLAKLEGSLVPKRDYSCSTGYDPVHEITAGVGVMGLNGAQTGFSGTFVTTISYHCQFWQKKTFADA